MSRKRDQKPGLLVRVFAELGAGGLSEGYIHDQHLFVHGQTVGQRITINPAIAVSDTVIHEILHRLEPGWSERYVRRTTTYLLRRCSDDQIQTIYDVYQEKVVKRKRVRTP